MADAAEPRPTLSRPALVWFFFRVGASAFGAVTAGSAFGASVLGTSVFAGCGVAATGAAGFAFPFGPTPWRYIGLMFVVGLLAYVRLRHGIGDGSDIGRMRRQQAFLGSVVAKVRAEGMTPTNIVNANPRRTSPPQIKRTTLTPTKHPTQVKTFITNLRQYP